ncbi:MAG: hypothetical protein IT287_00705 [Bdellovibrionaceae bacterium]|nr:hypothetical protein [Pseudobdellovibrionaceae bacterium]
MGAFKFRLESYFKLKAHEEKNAWNEVLKQQGRVSQIEDYIHTIKEAMTAARAGLSASGSKTEYSLGQAQITEESLSAMTIKVKHLQREKMAEEKTLELLKQKYFEKKKDAKIMENLKERKKAEFVKEQSKKEDNNNEEIARTMAQARKRTHE